MRKMPNRSRSQHRQRSRLRMPQCSTAMKIEECGVAREPNELVRQRGTLAPLNVRVVSPFAWRAHGIDANRQLSEQCREDGQFNQGLSSVSKHGCRLGHQNRKNSMLFTANTARINPVCGRLKWRRVCVGSGQHLI